MKRWPCYCEDYAFQHIWSHNNVCSWDIVMSLNCRALYLSSIMNDEWVTLHSCRVCSSNQLNREPLKLFKCQSLVEKTTLSVLNLGYEHHLFSFCSWWWCMIIMTLTSDTSSPFPFYICHSRNLKLKIMWMQRKSTRKHKQIIPHFIIHKVCISVGTCSNTQSEHFCISWKSYTFPSVTKNLVRGVHAGTISD